MTHCRHSSLVFQSNKHYLLLNYFIIFSYKSVYKKAKLGEWHNYAKLREKVKIKTVLNLVQDLLRKHYSTGFCSIVMICHLSATHEQQLTLREYLGVKMKVLRKKTLNVPLFLLLWLLCLRFLWRRSINVWIHTFELLVIFMGMVLPLMTCPVPVDHNS